MIRMRLLLFALGSLFLATAAQAQFELKVGNFNSIFASGPPSASGTPTAGQFATMGQVASASGPISVSAVHADRYPSTPDNTLVLVRSSMGSIFTSGVPRYFMGEQILPPLVQVDGVTPAAADYWRVQPVLPGETFTGVSPTVIPLGTVNVTKSATNLTIVEVASVPPSLVVGATLLGQPVTRVTGLVVTLAGNANATITSSTPASITPALSFYYSPHAEKVYASQPGRVDITWVTRVPNGGNYEIKSETFAVSSNTQLPVRTIFWTEGSFDGPHVQITDSRVTTVNPVFYSTVPKAVAEEVIIPGYNPVTPKLTTLSFEKYNGIGQINAYNVEGRIMVEYLGNVRLAGNIYDSVGIDVVDIKRVPSVSYEKAYLGFQIEPHLKAPEGQPAYVAAPLLSSSQTGASYYGTSTLPDGTSVYYAERETSTINDPDDEKPVSPDAYNKVVFYWLETGSFSIQWPLFQDRYWQRWSPNLRDYAHYTVDTAGSTTDTGVPFTGGLLPQIIYQDDPAQSEAQIDLATQRLFVTFANNADLRNRSLLKFNNSGKVWYVNLYSQAENRAQTKAATFSNNSTPTTIVTVPSTANLSVGMTVRGPGVSGSASILSILDSTHYVLSKYIPNDTQNLLYEAARLYATLGTPAEVVITVPSTAGLEDEGYTDAGEGSGLFGGYVTVLSPTQIKMKYAAFLIPDGTYNFNYYFNNFTTWAYMTSNVVCTATGQRALYPNWGYDVGSQASVELGMVVTNYQGENRSKIAGFDGSTLLLTDPGSGLPESSTYSISREISSTSVTNASDPTLVTVTDTSGLEVGMVLSGNDISGSVVISKILNGTQFETLGYVNNASNVAVKFTVESDASVPIYASATVGTRLTPPAGHELVGYISGGTGYYPAGYLNPFVVGVEAAKQGAIIPVNAMPNNRVLTVRWFKKVPAQGPEFQDLYVPGKIGRYTVSYPTTTDPEIVIAQGVGTGDLPPAEAAGTIYYQNNIAEVGYNPNEEHAPSILAGRAYALRDDLNVYPGISYNIYDEAKYTSEPFVLLAYTNPVDNRPAMHAYKVVRQNELYNFDYDSTAGTLLVKPYPLPLLPLPLVGTGAARTSKDIEIIGQDDPTNTAVLTDPAYKAFTFKDRKGFTWIHRGPHAGGSPTLKMKLYYPSLPGFFLPGVGEPVVGTILPFLRELSRQGTVLNKENIDNGEEDQPLEIIYRPVWPNDAPELRVAETLTLPKFGLPQVRGQASAQVYYQQSIAKDTTNSLTKSSVTLHDPTREKTVALDEILGFEKLPDAIKTTSYQGKTYFQALPPHLQKRFYFEPLRGALGTLVFIGTFHDVVAGEDYLDLNVLTAAEENLLKGLVPEGAAGESTWDTAINALKTRVETFKPDPAQFGSYVVDTYVNRGKDELTVISSPNTAVDSYALTATGQGTGYVTMIFGNGNAFTPEGDPVQVKVFKIADELYAGDLKVIESSNPLDEQVTLRHSGDFAGKPEDYEFEWRWTTGEASAPSTYETEMVKRIGGPTTNTWLIVRDPGALKPTAEQYAAAAPALPLQRNENVRPVNYAPNVTTMTVSTTAGLTVGMTVSGPGITGTATISKIVDSTHYVLSKNIPDGTNVLTYSSDTTKTLSTTSNTVESAIIEGTSYTDAEIEAGYPSLFFKSASGIDFTGTGVPGSIVFSAKAGSFDGFVLYVNNRVVLAHNAPEPQFSLTNASSGLTNLGKPSAGGDVTLKQFSIAPSFFKAGVNVIEVALYTTADANASSDINFVLEAAQETDKVDVNVTPSTVWQTPAAGDTNVAIVGGNPLNPFGGPQFVLNDRWFTMRYRPKASANNVLGTQYSRWAPPQNVEGWIKRVLAAINPFEQRVKDLYNNQVNTDVSVITQAGTKWEGDIALTLGNINDVGLIAIYETVLNRGKDMSIDANTNDADSNNALVLAAGYLNDLYSLLGNEAYADAANPTISIDDQTTVTEVNTSRYSFEAQVQSSLEEELALLRGRDDFISPGVRTAPAYNRLYWNYTRGINSGEVLYAVNYNIKEKVGSSTANGVIDEADAQRMFPQGHGDAYGHYLTALTGYYRLLTNQNFDWKPRAEAVTVAGQPVTVDFQDERKFAAAAGNLARTAEQIVGLVFRQSYKDDPADGWGTFRDTKGTNTKTNITRHQGLDEWVSRSTQGALFHWAVANAMVPDEDNYNTGVEKIDRTTVLEIPQLATSASTFQTTIDNANAHLNPLGLSPGAIAFDISPTEMQAGKSHFEQVYERSLRSLVNAAGAFNQASRMTRSLRDQQNQIDDYNTTIAQQESAYVNQLIDIFGRPYSGDVGAGKLYVQGYYGPDLTHWYIVDRPNNLVDTSAKFTVDITEAKQIKGYTGSVIDDVLNGFIDGSTTDVNAVTVQPYQLVQYNDVWLPGGLGTREETGALQEALQDSQQSYLALSEAKVRIQKDLAQLNSYIAVFYGEVQSRKEIEKEKSTEGLKITALEKVEQGLTYVAENTKEVAETLVKIGDAIAEYFPKSVGFSTDATSGARGAAKTAAATGSKAIKYTSIAATIGAKVAAYGAGKLKDNLAETIDDIGFDQKQKQMAHEFDNLYREVVTHANELMQLTLTHQRALQNVSNVIAKGNRILAEREVFRQRAAAIIQGYRTKDVTFRLFRNEALEQYRTLFDLASRYSYLAAKSYDYETGLLGSSEGRKVFDKIVASRSLGDLTGGVPQSTTSTLGDSGLAGTMAQLQADFSVAEGRLGINNPDQYGTVFSLRSELYRLLDDPTVSADDDAWQQTLEQHIVANLLTDSDVATQCRNLKKPDGSPVPGIIIPFSTTIQHGKNFFGLDLAAGDHNYTPGNFATKIYNVGIALPGYVGMDTYAAGNPNGAPTSNAANALSATPYVYLIPCGNDYMLAPPLGDTNTLRSWTVHDQALPLPYNLGATDFNSTQFFNANGTLSEKPWILRKHQPFRPVSDPTFFYGTVPQEFTNSRLIGRSVWNGQWKIVIPAYTLLNDEQTALTRFAASVKDIKLFLRTYSHSGN